MVLAFSIVSVSSLAQAQNTDSGCPPSIGIQICSFYAELDGLTENDGTVAYHFFQVDMIALTPDSHYWAHGSIYTPESVPQRHAGYVTLISGACRNESLTSILCEFSGRGNLFQVRLDKQVPAGKYMDISWYRFEGGSGGSWQDGSGCTMWTEGECE